MDHPNPTIARELVARIMKVEPVAVQRFTTGLHHYVYEVQFSSRDPVVLRMTTLENRDSMVGARLLSSLLRPRGVPLPEILATGLDNKFPYLILQRLPGTDLLHVIPRLTDPQLEAIAGHVSDAQKITAKITTAKKFGFAVLPENAPHDRWSMVLKENLARSRVRILKAGVFEVAIVAKVETLLEQLHTELDQQAARAFLHDTTTKNVIVRDDGCFSGIVDVDSLCFGDPRYAIALTKASLMNLGASLKYTNYWFAKSGFKEDNLFRLYVALFLVDFMSEHGQNFNNNAVISTKSNREHLQSVLTSALAEQNF